MDALLDRLRAGESIPANSIDVLAADRFGSSTVGLVWDELSLAKVTAHLDVDERHLQPFGLVHGGVWCSVVESTASFGGAMHAAVEGRKVVGVNNNTDFVRAMRDGRATAQAEPIHVGRSQQLWQVHIRRASDDLLVARGQVRLHSIDA